MANPRTEVTISCDRNRPEINEAEVILRKLHCQIHMYLDAYEQGRFVVRHNRQFVSPSLFSLYNLCLWVVKNEDELKQKVMVNV